MQERSVVCCVVPHFVKLPGSSTDNAITYGAWRELRQGCSNALIPKLKKDRESNPKPQGSGGNRSSIPTCLRYGKKHEGKYLVGLDGCFGCGKSNHKVKDFPLQANKGKNGRQARPSGSELDMVDFDSILGIDWLHACYASIDYRNRLVTFKVLNEPIMSWEGGNNVLKGQFISFLKARKMISKGCI
ncbi:hypothetical protein MTR67_030734 [Solanum verrucosum]|uniref:Uncharacterized protein n=1 Tax=Solanum verrucosum TaxID=315347 RepID=A0AAF0U154_SOLVR|nr:hypothetical protein MTR67_030734 [Solanum verrucosum]